MNHNEQDDLERQAVTGKSVERGGARPLTDDELATLRPGARVLLDRFIPATSAGPARRMTHVLTIELRSSAMSARSSASSVSWSALTRLSSAVWRSPIAASSSRWSSRSRACWRCRMTSRASRTPPTPSCGVAPRMEVMMASTLGAPFRAAVQDQAA